MTRIPPVGLSGGQIKVMFKLFFWITIFDAVLSLFFVTSRYSPEAAKHDANLIFI